MLLDPARPLLGKTALVFGVASDQSIAWAIAQELAAQGANIILGYQFRYHSRMVALAPQLPNLYKWERCDVLNDAECDAFFNGLGVKIDIVIHAIAFAPATAVQSRVVETTADDFATTMLISAHSLAKIADRVRPYMVEGGSIIALSYLGAVRVAANYKVMGVAKAALEALVRELAVDLGPDRIRVNAISAGPIRTLAASGLSDLDLLLEYDRANSPLGENVTQADVADCAAFLAGDRARMITGQTIYVDGGYSVIAVPKRPASL